MNLKKEKLLKKVYDDYIKLMLYDFLVERLGDLIAEDVSGYGTTVDEKILEIKRFKKVVTDQREQGAGIEMEIGMTPIQRRVSPNEDTVLFMDEFEINMVLEGEKNMIPLRLTSVFEFNENTWKLIHLHGSKAVETEGDTWHLNEWKKKNEELQRMVDEKTADLERKNRELEIEAALERVLTVAMSMHQPDDLLDVCQIISQQLELLNLKNIRNVQVAIIDESRKNYANYQYFTPYKKSVFEATNYESNPASRDMVKEMKKSANSFFIGNIKGEELKNFREWRNNNNQFHDPLMDKSPAVFYYFYSIGEGGLGLTTYKEISDENLAIFKRFHKVFTLAYRRFIDIKLAEAQAYEARLETALERVRAIAMAMHIPEDLSAIGKTIFTELKSLGFANLRNTEIVISNDEKETVTSYHYSAYGQEEFIEIGYKENPIVKKWAEDLKKAEDAFVPVSIPEKELKAWDKYRLELGYRSDPHMAKAKAVHYYSYSIGLGALSISTWQTLFNDQINILERFRNVFRLAYQRYKDLEKALAQVREAKIEGALERVRSRTMGMTKGEELAETALLLFEQITHLGIKPRSCGFLIMDDKSQTMEDWSANLDEKGGASIITGVLAFDQHPIIAGVVATWRKGQPYYIGEVHGEELQKYYKAVTLNEATPNEIRDKVLLESRSEFTNSFYFGYGMMYVLTPAAISEEQINIMLRFATVFKQTYTRFLDLKKAEEQAREAQIEAALERVRSRTMGMQRSDELQEAAVMLFQQVVALGVPAFGTGFNIWDDDRKFATAWMAGIDRMQPPFKTSSSEDIFLRIYEAAEREESLFVEEQGGEALKIHYEYMNSIPVFKEIADKMAAAGQAFPIFQIMHCAFFTQGYLMFISYESVSNAYDIFKRFAKVFEQTYTRFLDLKKSEAQAREAIKQASLDRIRGQIASMRTTEDLLQLTPLVWRELNTLEVPFFRCGIFILDERKKHVNVYLTTPDGKSLGALDLDFETNDLARATVASWKKKEVYLMHWNREEFIAWTKEMMKLGQIKAPEKYQGAEKPPESLHLHFIPFAQGMLYVGHQEQLEKEKIDLVKSLAEAFSFAYARYEDFVVLEEAKERVEKALSDLKATQTQLIHAEKMASLGELTAGIAHEIQNPLNFVNNFSEVSADLIEELNEELQKGDTEEVTAIAKDLLQNLEKISHHGKRASNIVKSMLEHSRSGTGEKQLTDLNALADEYLRLAYHGLRAKDKSFNAEFRLEADQNLPKTSVISQEIGRVLLNLINNAFYAVSEKAKKKLNSYQPEVVVSTRTIDTYIEINVKDNGSGIKDSVKEKIFQPFFTTKPAGQGTGLGLSMSYDIVTKGHGGEMSVETMIGEGSQFSVKLPLTIN